MVKGIKNLLLKIRMQKQSVAIIILSKCSIDKQTHGQHGKTIIKVTFLKQHRALVKVVIIIIIIINLNILKKDTGLGWPV